MTKLEMERVEEEDRVSERTKLKIERF